ncbi:recombinase RecT [uncultured Paraglaciecola sp.]|uniref:recombinase RecT n=1 Tax=uncultured Paraglaciecola sp. TaxID=1765024 RepID=UPI00260F4B7A|nr:recombinase RecT [uncultured Paraglaciecola sp.]
MGELVKEGVDFSVLAKDVYIFADKIKNAGDFIPSNLQGNAGAIAACMLSGIELGFKPMASLRLMYVHKGNVGISASGIIALLKGAGYAVEWPESSEEVATVVITAPDKTSIEMSYTKQDAETAGLWGKVHKGKYGNVDSVWKLHPKAMLRARCISNAAKAFAGEVLAGIYTHDEIDEIKEREEKPVNEIKTSRKSGVQEAKNALGITESSLDGEEIEKVKGEEVAIYDYNDPVATESELLLDEIQAANTIRDLEICAEKIKSKTDISDEDKDLLREDYKKQKDSLNG